MIKKYKPLKTIREDDIIKKGKRLMQCTKYCWKSNSVTFMLINNLEDNEIICGYDVKKITIEITPHNRNDCYEIVDNIRPYKLISVPAYRIDRKQKQITETWV